MSARMTLLEMTQNILSALESDEVNSISDTVESLQVANEIVTTYYELFSNRSLPSNKSLTTLEGLSDADYPNYLKIPDDVQTIEWLKYQDEEGVYRELIYLCPEDFVTRTTRFSGQEAYIQVADIANPAVKLNIVTDASPRYWTTFDNKHIVFNSFNSSVDTTVHEAKSLCSAVKLPNLPLSDDAIPDLDIGMFPLLLSEAKKACFINFKGVSNANEERRARRQLVRSQNDLWRADQRRPYNRTPNYGRRR